MYLNLCYTVSVANPLYWQQEGGVVMHDNQQFLRDVMVNVTAYYVYKWLDVLFSILFSN